MRTTRVIAASLVLAVCVGCSSDDDAAAPSTSAASDLSFEAPEAAAVTQLDQPDPGGARVVLGSLLDVELTVTACELDPSAMPDGEIPAERLVLRAEGEGPAGTPIVLDALRLASQAASPTITDTVRVTEGPADAPSRVLEAQRFEVGGLVTDPRDPAADAPLLTVDGGRIAAHGVFAPPGAFAADGGLVEGLVAATCG